VGVDTWEVVVAGTSVVADIWVEVVEEALLGQVL
jgi:hypothetical protein